MPAPPPDVIRERIFAELDQLRPRYYEALRPGHANVFPWLDIELWVDRKRKLIIDSSMAQRFNAGGHDSLPEDAASDFTYRGCRHSLTPASHIADLLAAFTVGKGRWLRTAALVADFVNFTIAQPTVNPAFGPLFWLGLETEFDPRRSMAESLGEGIGALAIDLARYPDSRAEAGDVRTAQVAFVREHFDTGLDDTWLTAPDEAWTRRCSELLRANRLEWTLDAIAEKAENIERGVLA